MSGFFFCVSTADSALVAFKLYVFWVNEAHVNQHENVLVKCCLFTRVYGCCLVLWPSPYWYGLFRFFSSFFWNMLSMFVFGQASRLVSKR